MDCQRKGVPAVENMTGVRSNFKTHLENPENKGKRRKCARERNLTKAVDTVRAVSLSCYKWSFTLRRFRVGDRAQYMYSLFKFETLHIFHLTHSNFLEAFAVINRSSDTILLKAKKWRRELTPPLQKMVFSNLKFMLPSIKGKAEHLYAADTFKGEC